MDRRRPPRLIGGQGGDKGTRTVVERDVVGVGGDALGIKSDKDVDGGGRLLFCRRLDFSGRSGDEGLAEKGGDLVGGPGSFHGIRKVTALEQHLSADLSFRA